jgi:sugar phosphate permease
MSTQNYKRLIKTVAFLVWATVFLVGATTIDARGPANERAVGVLLIASGLLGLVATASASVSSQVLIKQWGWKVVIFLGSAIPILCLFLFLASLWLRFFKPKGYEALSIFFSFASNLRPLSCRFPDI